MTDEINRDALLIYLDNIRTIETIIYESDKKTAITDNDFNSWNNPKALRIWGIISIVASVALFLIDERFMLVVPIIIGISYFVRAGKLENAEKELESHISADRNTRQEWETLLQQAYSVDIIPLQFRNIQGIYYLYDYISTSNQTLSDALMQCNLEAIKQKLDESINLQSRAIIQQAQANAALYEQNQRILETAEKTANNTATAAKYAKISAVNSQLALKMQSKQLAYQRADFFLN